VNRAKAANRSLTAVAVVFLATIILKFVAKKIETSTMSVNSKIRYDFSREDHRLATYADSFPGSGGSSNNACPLILARLGFRCTGHDDDTIVCCHCQTEVRGWSTSDDVKRKHGSCLQHFDRSDEIPSVFSAVRQRLPTSRSADRSSPATARSTDVRDCTGGTPNDSTSTVVKSHSPFYEVCEATLRRASRKNFSDIYNRAVAAADESVPADVVIDRTKPNLELLKVESARLATFHDWPETAKHVVEPRDLAKAGMFYTGQADRVQCAFCRGCLRNWARGDNPTEEHRKKFPDCSFVRGADAGTLDFVDSRLPNQVCLNA